MFEDLKKNIIQEKKIIADIKSVLSGMQNDSYTRPFYKSTLIALIQQLRILNNTVPEMLKENSPLKKLYEGGTKEKEIVKMTYVSPITSDKNFITLDKKDKREYLEKLKISSDNLREINKIKINEKGLDGQKIKPNFYAKISNQYFRKYSDKWAPHFGNIARDLKKGNIPFLLSSYISMMLMSVTIAFLSGIILFLLILIMDVNNWTFFWIPFGLVALVFGLFYLYPSSEASSVQKKINQELPFATIHMAAIAGSDIEPTKIFKIISKSKDYPNTGIEIRKVTTQTDVYGYDLVTSLKNVASRTSNKKLSELFSGLATNISSGGELKNYLEKKAENFLLDYQLERQKYSDLAGTFMDIYISILITAPLVLMMMFIVMNVAGMGIAGMGIEVLLFISVGAIVVINIIFIAVLNVKQPSV
ncbi:MAG: type II secretion system F family protein [Candidatus Pacearchaeota archaeon]